MISGDCEIIEPLIIMDKKYNGYRMSAADAQRVAHQIAFAPIVFQVSRLMIKYGIFAMLEEAGRKNPAGLTMLKSLQRQVFQCTGPRFFWNLLSRPERYFTTTVVSLFPR